MVHPCLALRSSCSLALLSSRTIIARVSLHVSLLLPLDCCLFGDPPLLDFDSIHPLPSYTTHGSDSRGLSCPASTPAQERLVSMPIFLCHRITPSSRHPSLPTAASSHHLDPLLSSPSPPISETPLQTPVLDSNFSNPSNGAQKPD